ncbi:hypothetical protein D1AOALGA4SA_8811 [Olavius algarvensis Delta 1 endosymbiont]|nr:hypothetical protein D1AOALGA4SA_8811 [Olavius algarvensis Delta 1 endosymbiont]
MGQGAGGRKGNSEVGIIRLRIDMSSGIRYRASNIEYPVSSIQQRAGVIIDLPEQACINPFTSHLIDPGEFEGSNSPGNVRISSIL